MCVSISGLLRNYGKKSMAGLFTKEDKTPCTDKEVRIFLAECQQKGYRVLPLGECNNFDYQEGCLGH